MGLDVTGVCCSMFEVALPALILLLQFEESRPIKGTKGALLSLYPSSFYDVPATGKLDCSINGGLYSHHM